MFKDLKEITSNGVFKDAGILGQWRGIDTAPRDGTWVMGYYSGNNWEASQIKNGGLVRQGKHNIVIIQWHEPSWSSPHIDKELNKPNWRSFGASSYHERDISHWQPLQPPKKN